MSLLYFVHFTCFRWPACRVLGSICVDYRTIQSMSLPACLSVCLRIGLRQFSRTETDRSIKLSTATEHNGNLQINRTCICLFLTDYFFFFSVTWSKFTGQLFRINTLIWEISFSSTTRLWINSSKLL